MDMDAAELAKGVTPVAKAAIDAFGTDALTRDADENGDPTAELGSDILQSIYWRSKNVSQLEGAVTDLAERPTDEDAVGEVRLQITKAFEADETLLKQVEQSLHGEGGAAASTDDADADDDVVVSADAASTDAAAPAVAPDEASQG